MTDMNAPEAPSLVKRRKLVARGVERKMQERSSPARVLGVSPNFPSPKSGGYRGLISFIFIGI
jgi:hypothetical protein